MLRCNHDIVRVLSVLSHRRKYYGQQHKRASLAPRSDPPALGRRESRCDLPSFAALAALVRQVVGLLSAKPAYRLCLPLALSAPLAAADARQCRTSGARASAAVRTGRHSRDALRLDWCARYLGTPQGIARLSLAQ